MRDPYSKTWIGDSVDYVFRFAWARRPAVRAWWPVCLCAVLAFIIDKKLSLMSSVVIAALITSCAWVVGKRGRTWSQDARYFIREKRQERRARRVERYTFDTDASEHDLVTQEDSRRARRRERDLDEWRRNSWSEDRAWYRRRLEDPELWRRGVLLRTLKLAVPLGGNRVSGDVFVEDEDEAWNVIQVLSNHEGFDGLRYDAERSMVAWGQPVESSLSVYERGTRYGYRPDAIERYMAQLGARGERTSR